MYSVFPILVTQGKYIRIEMVVNIAKSKEGMRIVIIGKTYIFQIYCSTHGLQ